MAFSAFAGNFALNTSTGNQSVTGTGFLPKIVLFLPTILTADGITEHAHTSIGAAISSTERFALTANSEDAQGTSDSFREDSTSLCILKNTPGTSAADFEADFVSQDADGFTVNITDAPVSAVRSGFLALGGSDLTNVDIGNFTLNTSTGNQSVTGIGFQPDAIIFVSRKATAVGTDGNMHFMLGYAVSSTQRGVTVLASDTGEATSVTNRFQENDACLAGMTNAGAKDYEADFVSMDADGFTVNITDAPASAWLVHWIALKGGQYAVGDITSQTSTGNFSETGTGFTPVGGIFSSFLNAASATVVSDNEISIGFVTSTTERFSAGCSDEDGQGTTDADSYSNDGLIYENYNFNQTLEGSIDFVSWNADGFTLDQVDADPSGNEIIYFVFGNDAAPPAPSTNIGFITASSETYSKPTYELYLTDDFGKRLAQLSTFLALDASRAANQIGFFNIRMPLSFNPDFIQPDRMVQVWRAPAGGRLKLWRTYFVRKWEFSTQGNDRIIEFGGPDTNDLLRRRIIAAYTASAQASKTDFADDMMKEIVTESLADGVAPVPDAGTRVWNDLSIAGDLGLGPTITKSFPFDKLLTSSGQGALAVLAKAAREEGTEVFFDTVPNVVSSSSINFQFQTFTGQPGQDHTSRVVFSQDNNNMRNPSLLYDYTEEENYIYATGQGEEDLRNVQQVYDSDRYSVSQWARIEGEADARNQSSDNGVIAAGNDKLNAGRPRIKFSAIPIDVRGTRFGRDWDYGDKVTVKYLNIEFETIIRAVALSVDDDGNENITAKLDFESLI